MEKAAFEPVLSGGQAFYRQAWGWGWSGEQRHYRRRNSLSKSMALVESRSVWGMVESFTVTED